MPIVDERAVGLDAVGAESFQAECPELLEDMLRYEQRLAAENREVRTGSLQSSLHPDYANDSPSKQTARPRIYLPAPMAASSDLRRVIFLIRAAGEPGPLVDVVRRTIPKAVVGHAVVNANTFDQINRVGSQEMLVGFAPLVPLVATGLVLGVGLMFGLRQVVRAAGGGGSAFDPQWRAFAIPMLIVVVIGIVATWLPSRRARRINPVQLLRSSSVVVSAFRRTLTSVRV